MASAESPSSSDSAVKNPNSGGSAVENPTPRCRQVLEFNDTTGIFTSYLGKWQIEVDPNFNYLDSCDDSEEKEEIRKFPNLHEKILTHLQQVRDSFGFDVDCFVPYWASVSYFPLNLSDPNTRDQCTAMAKVVVDGINADMDRKVYELVEVVKAVYCHNHSTNVTFKAKKVDADVDDQANSNSVVTIQAIVRDCASFPKELQQWRFKP